jgi:hypothetical protein
MGKFFYTGRSNIILMEVLVGLKNQTSYMGKFYIWEKLYINFPFSDSRWVVSVFKIPYRF